MIAPLVMWFRRLTRDRVEEARFCATCPAAAAERCRAAGECQLEVVRR